MTTAADIIGSALRKIGSVDPNEPIDASDYETCISALNRLMMRWEAKTITLGWQPVTNPGDEISAPMEAEDAIIYNLAIMIAPEYGAQISMPIIAAAKDALADLKQSIYTTRVLQLHTDMPSSHSGPRWNMYTDGPNY